MGANRSGADPFIEVQRDASDLLEVATGLFHSFCRIRMSSGGTRPIELIEARNDLESTLHDLQENVTDLQRSVAAIEQDPNHFGLHLQEVRQRREFVKKLAGKIEQISDEIHGPPGTRQNSLASDHFASASAGYSIITTTTSEHERLSPVEQSSDRAHAYHQEQKRLRLIQEQDQVLEGVFRTVGNLRAQAGTIGRELEEQTEILVDLDSVADRVGGKLQNGMSRLTTTIGKNEDSLSSVCIAILIFVLMLVLLLLLIL